MGRIMQKPAFEVVQPGRTLNRPAQIWASSRENLYMPYVNNKGLDQPAHPCSLILLFPA